MSVSAGEIITNRFQEVVNRNSVLDRMNYKHQDDGLAVSIIFDASE